MQSIELNGMSEVQKAFDQLPEVIRQAKADVFEAVGQELLSQVQVRIGGPRVSAVQEYQVGSGKGYVAVRAMAKTELDGYAAGYITNALENGHAIRTPSGKAKRERKSRARVAAVRGKYMYRETQEANAIQLAEEGAKRIEETAVAYLNAPSKQATSDTKSTNRSGWNYQQIVGYLQANRRAS
jgi:hypothetical protein